MRQKNLNLWVFGNIGLRCVYEGLWRGTLYGLLYGTGYGACVGGWIVGCPYGLIIGAVVGMLLGLACACVLGTFSALWVRRRDATRIQGQESKRTVYRRTFTLIGVVTTIAGGLIAFPIIGSALINAGWFDPAFVLAPSVIAGMAAFQASRRVVSWYEINVEGREISLTNPAMNQEGIWPPPPTGSA